MSDVCIMTTNEFEISHAVETGSLRLERGQHMKSWQGIDMYMGHGC